ncbi:hypothetical protein LXL04_024414 [Taraxacum kok-saghyz]
MSDFGETPNNNWKIQGSGFLNQKRSNPYPHHDHQPLKAARPDPYNNTMSINTGTFTHSQWMELELHALIYKHIVANVPVPSILINHVKKSLDPFVFFGSSSTSNAPNLHGWGLGGFRLGFPASNDPEPGRCRRTDGKKWRCSKEAVPDQKYCEKHINRGRHRSRKLVEDKNGGRGGGGGGGINNHVKNLQFQNIRPEEDRSDWTQLTMSMDSSDFSSSAISLAQEKLTIAQNEASDSIPDSWQRSTGGPLGEALKTSSSNLGNGNHQSWCWNSPTGVFSRSNSSSGSSPRGNQEDGGDDEMFSLTRAQSSV